MCLLSAACDTPEQAFSFISSAKLRVLPSWGRITTHRGYTWALQCFTCPRQVSRTVIQAERQPWVLFNVHYNIFERRVCNILWIISGISPAVRRLCLGPAHVLLLIWQHISNTNPSRGAAVHQAQAYLAIKTKHHLFSLLSTPRSISCRCSSSSFA